MGKSISGILKNKKTYQQQQRTLFNWIEGWHKDQMETIELIYKAMKEERRADAFRYIDQLRTITDKRFIGLINVANIVSDPSRHLLDERERVDRDLDITDESEEKRMPNGPV